VRRCEQGVREQTRAAAELHHRREKAAGPAEVLGRDDVGDDARKGGACRVEEELDDGVADDDLPVAVRGCQHQQARKGQQSGADHDRAPAPEAG